MTEQADTVTCKFPGCQNPPEPATDKPGRPPGYCADKAHNATTAWRERKRLAAAEHGTTTSDAEAEQPVTMARINGAELLRQMRALADTLTATAGRLTSTVADLGDTGAVEAEVEAARKAAEKRATIAESAQADAEALADAAGRARVAAEEAAEDMAAQLDTAQAEAREARDQLAEGTAAHAAELAQVRSDA